MALEQSTYLITAFTLLGYKKQKIQTSILYDDEAIMFILDEPTFVKKENASLSLYACKRACVCV